MGKVLPFRFNNDNKIKQWLDTAKYVGKEYGMGGAARWVKKNVPPQFHTLLKQMLMKEKFK